MELHTWRTPNGRKVPILLAELGWTYELELVDLTKREQKQPSYTALNPNGKIPTLVDGELVVFESGAILQYLAEKSGRFLPRSGRARWDVLSWLYWQIGGTGPMFGQLVGFEREEPRDEHGVEKFAAECRRLVHVFDGTLAAKKRDFIGGEYSIADIAAYPWFAGLRERDPRILEGADALRLWMERMSARPAVKQGMALEAVRIAMRSPSSMRGDKLHHAPR